jgi:hypothetical protein
MARKRARGKTDLDVVGFLSVMSIVTGLICLILFVIALRIAMNPKLLKIVSFKLFSSSRASPHNPKIPSYIDCWPDKVMIYPGNKALTWEDLQQPRNELEKMLDKIQENTDQEYVIVMVRPQSVKFYRTVRSMLGKRAIDIGYDAIDADFKVNWSDALKSLGVAEE